jgi:glycine cleavage system aminomethyltransferase T
MQHRSLEDLLQSVSSPVELLRNSQVGPYVYPVVPPEFTNWRDEQRAWQETCVLFNQSYHMTDMYLEGPDALKLLTHLGVNSFKNFTVNKAKQFVACSYDGYVLGDVVLCYLDENRFNLVGRPSIHNWVRFHLETGGYDAEAEMDERAAARQGPITRKAYRFQVQGPNAMDVIKKATGKPAPDVKFFNMDWITIAGRKVRALRHGMAGQPGFELFGPWEEGEEVRTALVAAGEEHGLRQVGARAYSSNTLESGWIPSPMPAVYSGDSMKAFREWLPADGYEAKASLGGSFYSDDINDYYLTPHDLGYGRVVKFDHDFVGREALEKMPEVYSTLPYDQVLRNGKHAGISTWCGYSFNERRMLTLAMLDRQHAAPGTEVTLLWGEKDGGSSKPTVERHVQTEIRATVCTVPYSRTARTAYRD